MEQRKDDTEEVVKARLEVYKANAGPVEDYSSRKKFADGCSKSRAASRRPLSRLLRAASSTSCKGTSSKA